MPLEFVSLAQSCPTRRDFESAALERLSRAVGFDVAFLAAAGAESRATVVGVGADGIREAFARGEDYAEELLPVKRAALARHGVAIDTEVLGVAAVRKTRYHRELAAPVGGGHSLFALVPFQGRPVAGLVLGRGGRGFSSSEVARVEALLPELGVARAVYGWPTRFAPLPLPRRFAQRVIRACRGPLASVPTPGGRLVVRDRGRYREMIAEQGATGSALVWSRAGLSDPSESGWPYIELFHLAAALAKHRERALFLGCGGAVVLRQFARSYPGLELEVVEPSRAVIDLARSHFALDEIPRLTVHLGDGVEFVAQAPGDAYDIAIVDAYDETALPPGLSERSFFRSLRRILCVGGAVACNVIGTLSKQGAVAEVVSLAHAEFGNARVVPVIAPGGAFMASAARNVVVIAVRDV